jgi:RNA polymerase sigma-32 factor
MTEATSSLTVPSLTSDDGLGRYVSQIRRFPMLRPDQEYSLAKRYAEDLDATSAARLVTSHLRLVVKIAMGYRGYGMPVSELISEGNLGLVRAVKKFEPDRGFRLSTYARWWIKAQMQEFILRSWSLVKIGTTGAQKKLFFNLRRLKNVLNAFEDGDLRPEDVRHIAEELGVEQVEVVNMNRRMSLGGDASLNVSLAEEGGSEWQDWLTDDEPLADEQMAAAQESQVRHEMLDMALKELNERERQVLTERRLVDEPRTLEDLSVVFGVSRERVRQIEVRAFEKLQKAIERIALRRAAPMRMALAASM